MPRMIKLLFALASLVLSVSLYWSFSSSDVSRQGKRGIASARADQATRTDIWFDPKPGYSYEYGFHRKIEISGLGNSFPPIEYSGVLSLDIVATEADTFEAIARERVEGQEGGAKFRLIANRAGNRLQLFAPEKKQDENYSHESVMKDLLSLLFFPLESDTTGAYSAHFEPAPAKTGLLGFRKQKLAYQPPVKAEVLSSFHSMLWSQELSMPQTIEGTDKTSMGEQIETSSSYQILFRTRVAVAKARKEELANLSRKESLELKAQKISLKDHPDYAHLNWAEVADRLRKASSLSSSEQLKLFGDLVKLLQMGGAGPGDLLAAVRSGNEIAAGAKSAIFQQVVGALATDGSTESQAALLDLYQDPGLPVSGKGSILGALTTTQAPLDSSTRAFLEAEMAGEQNKDLAEGAAFALGSSLEKAGNDAEALGAVEKILAAWNSSSDLSERLTLLDVMGNSGRVEFLPAISSVLPAAGNSSAIRAKAAFSLRFIQSASARSLLVASLSDTDSAVRTGAARGIDLAPWSEVFRDPVTSCSSAEPDAEVRRICSEVQVRHSALAQAQ